MLKDGSCNTCEGRDDDGKEHCYRIEAVMHVIDAMAMVIDIVMVFLL